MIEPTDLLGTWALTRVIEDHLAGERRDVRGTATLTAAGPDRVVWSETGTMTWPGHEVAVGRTLEVVRTAGVWTVHFEDGRVFHPWSVGRPVEHPCTPDHYTGQIEAFGDPVASWRVVWAARGPHKDYRMSTEHTGRH